MTLTLFLALALQAGAAEPAKIAEAGLQAAKRLGSTAASWTVTHQTPTGAQFVVDVLRAKDRRRMILSGGGGGQIVELARILERDGAWYLTEGESAGKYRPYEAPLSLPTAYLYLTKSDVLLVSDAAALEGWKREDVAAGVATYRSPLPDSARALVERIAAQMEATGLPQVKKPLADLKDVLEHGLSMKLDVKTGMVLELANAQRRQSLSNFQWREKLDEKEFAVPDRKWTDATGDPVAGDPGELLMLGHNGLWRPGFPKGELEARLLDLKSGALRRVPFKGPTAVPGCFLKDRRKVVVSALTDDGALGLYEVDLSTGANRRLGGKLLETGFALFPVVSPDGKSLAALHKSGAGQILESQVTVIDLASGGANYVGKPLDTAFVSWRPDGKGFFLIQREYPDRSKPAIATVSTMDLEGTLTPLVRGDFPVLLADGTTILFHDSGQWKSCDLQGKNAKPYGDGLQGYGFPSPAPDGKRILMMRFRPGQAPQPVILKIGESEGVPATEIPGMWGIPAWR